MKMREVDMSAKGVTARLKLMSELRRLGVALSKAKMVTPKREEPTRPAKSQETK
jgi:hypothetical protein